MDPNNESELDEQENQSQAPVLRNQYLKQTYKYFDITKESRERGAKPDSNLIKEKEVALISSKHDKIVEIFKSSSEIYSLLKDQT